MLKQFSVANKTKSSQNCGFSGIKGLNIKYIYRDPQKALLYPERRLLTYCAYKYVQGLGCSLIEEPKKIKRKTSHIKRHDRITYLGSRNP